MPNHTISGLRWFWCSKKETNEEKRKNKREEKREEGEGEGKDRKAIEGGWRAAIAANAGGAQDRVNQREKKRERGEREKVREGKGEPTMANNGSRKAREASGGPSPSVWLKQGQEAPVSITKM